MYSQYFCKCTFTLQIIKQYYTSAQSNKESVNRRYPFLMMNITIPASTVDVNLTPDKTEVMLQNKVQKVQTFCPTFIL